MRPSAVPILQRCSCGCSSDHKTECATGKANRLDRHAAGDAPASAVAPASVHATIARGGVPLSGGARREMQAFFDQDLGDVRLHHDASAARSAADVGARAYTVGPHVVFGSGGYTPGTDAGRGLLAHELTHVLQQRGTGGPAGDPIAIASHDAAEREAHAIGLAASAPGVNSAAAARTSATAPAPGLRPSLVTPARGPVLDRQPTGGPATTRPGPTGPATTTIPTGTFACSADQTKKINAAWTTAGTWLGKAIPALTAYIGNPASDIGGFVTRALTRNFHATDAATATTVRNKLTLIQGELATSTPSCPTETQDPSCAKASKTAAYVHGTPTVTVCPVFFDESDVEKAILIVHELAHQTTGNAITDLAYLQDRYYRISSTPDALRNAEPYAELTYNIGTHLKQGQEPPKDDHTDCPSDWAGALDRAAAIAQRWNRKGQDLLHSPTDSANHSALIAKHLGSSAPAVADHARSVYDKAAEELYGDIPFECEPGATGGRCKTSTLYWYMPFLTHHLHVCPKWMALGTDTARAGDLLGGFYAYKGLGRDWTDRQNIVNLAQEFAQTTGTDPHPVQPPPASPTTQPPAGR